LNSKQIERSKYFVCALNTFGIVLKIFVIVHASKLSYAKKLQKVIAFRQELIMFRVVKEKISICSFLALVCALRTFTFEELESTSHADMLPRQPKI